MFVTLLARFPTPHMKPPRPNKHRSIRPVSYRLAGGSALLYMKYWRLKILILIASAGVIVTGEHNLRSFWSGTRPTNTFHFPAPNGFYRWMFLVDTGSLSGQKEILVRFYSFRHTEGKWTSLTPELTTFPTNVAPPACHGLFIRCALFHQRTPSACCCTPHIWPALIALMERDPNVRWRAKKPQLDVRSLRVSLLRPTPLLKITWKGENLHTCSAELPVSNETTRSPSANRSTVSIPFVVYNPSFDENNSA